MSPARRPLDGIRIADLTAMWAGPYATMVLADFGADVIKVEAPRAWDNLRTLIRPPLALGEHWWNSNAYFQEYNRNKRSLTLDLTNERGKELFGRLVAQSDVVIENFRADVMDRLGIGPDWLREQCEDIIVVGMASFGKTGPDASAMAYGPVVEQLSGLASLTGYGDGIPFKTGVSYGDPVAGVAAAAAVVTALIQRRRTGRGQVIDLAQREPMTTLIGEAFMEWAMNGRLVPHRGNESESMAPHNAYACAGEDEWIAIAVRSDKEWTGLRSAMGDPEEARDDRFAAAASRPEHREDLDRIVGAWTATLSKQEAFERCHRHGVPAGPVWTVPELLGDPHLAERGYYEDAEHPEVGTWAMHGWLWRTAGAGPCILAPAPDLGSDNREILGGLLGVSAEEIDALEAIGVIGDTPIGERPRSEIVGSRR